MLYAFSRSMNTVCKFVSLSLNQSPYKMNGFDSCMSQHKSKLVPNNRHTPPQSYLHKPLSNFHSVAQQLDTLIVVAILNLTFILVRWDHCAPPPFF